MINRLFVKTHRPCFCLTDYGANELIIDSKLRGDVTIRGSLFPSSRFSHFQECEAEVCLDLHLFVLCGSSESPHQKKCDKCFSSHPELAYLAVQRASAHYVFPRKIFVWTASP